MFSAYDIKKILPRAVFALVGISLSWALMSILINFMGFLGDSIESIILESFSAASSQLTTVKLDATTGGWFVALAALAVGSAGLGLIPVLGLLLAGVTGVGLAFIIILIRRVALVALVVLAPLAIAMSVLPQTEKIFKNWWEWFFKLLLMYPFLMAMFAFSRVAAGIFSITGSDSSGAGITSTIYQFAAIAILIAPYFLVGKAFSFAGGTIGKLAGMVNNRDKGLIDKTKKWEAGKVAERRTDAKAGSRYGGKNFVTRGINRTLRDASMAPRTAFRGQAKRDSEIIAANQKAAAALEEIRPGVKGATKEELKIGALAPNEKAAKAAMERLVQEEIAKGSTEAEARAKWGAALSGWKSKVGSLDSASATYALTKATEAGLLSAGEIKDTTSQIGQNLGMRGVVTEDGEAGRVSGAMNAGLEGSLRASGSAFGFGPTAKDAPALSTLNPSERAALTGTVEGMFEGEKQMSFEALGKINQESAATVRTIKVNQVANVLSGLAGGVIAQDQAEEQLKEHRKHALLLAQSAANEKNAAAATEAANLLSEIDAAIAAHNASAGPAGPTVTATGAGGVIDDSLNRARARAKPL